MQGLCRLLPCVLLGEAVPQHSTLHHGQLPQGLLQHGVEMGLFRFFVHVQQFSFRLFVWECFPLLPSFIVPGNRPLQAVSVIQRVRLALNAHAGPETVLCGVMQVGGELVALLRLVGLHSIVQGKERLLLQVLQRHPTLGTPLFPLAGVELPRERKQQGPDSAPQFRERRPVPVLYVPSKLFVCH